MAARKTTQAGKPAAKRAARKRLTPAKHKHKRGLLASVKESDLALIAAMSGGSS